MMMAMILLIGDSEECRGRRVVAVVVVSCSGSGKNSNGQARPGRRFCKDVVGCGGGGGGGGDVMCTQQGWKGGIAREEGGCRRI